MVRAHRKQMAEIKRDERDKRDTKFYRLLLGSALLFITVFFNLSENEIFGQSRRYPAKNAGTVKAVEKPLPELVLLDIAGGRWRLSEQRGKVVLLNFWATWCAPCRTEIPFLARINDKYESKGLKVFGIAVDSENTDLINVFIKDYKINYRILLAKAGTSLSRQKALPMTLLIDEKGFLVKKYVGAVKEDVFEKDIDALLVKKTKK
jgi:thiol-disulfide isomerase/thioredoxin